MIRQVVVLCMGIMLVFGCPFLSGCSKKAETNSAEKVSQAGASTQSPLIATTSYDGYHEATTCDGLYGWAWDKTKPDTPVQVDIYEQNTLLATVTANQLRKDLINAKIGNGYHGFTFTIPSSLKDGKSHSIRITIAGTQIDLRDSPKEITCR